MYFGLQYVVSCSRHPSVGLSAINRFHTSVPTCRTMTQAKSHQEHGAAAHHLLQVLFVLHPATAQTCWFGLCKQHWSCQHRQHDALQSSLTSGTT